jgi:hypothetical protein
MRSLAIETHVVGDGGGLTLPRDDIIAAFSNAGVDLTFTEGDAIDVDPAQSALTSYEDLVADYRAKDRSFGHLIIGKLSPHPGRDVVGELLDLASRGVAAVYTSSEYIQAAGEDGLAQTAAHELGHMCNLSHGDVSTAYQSTMERATSRTEAVSDAWAFAAAEAKTVEPAYYSAPARIPACYPFALQARSLLNTLSPSQTDPWGSPFEHTGEAADDTWRASCAISLRAHSSPCRVGGPLAFDLLVRNTSEHPVRVPFRLHPTFGGVSVRVHGPDGASHVHQPRTLGCSSRSRILPPGDAMRYPFCSLRGPSGGLFTRAGRHAVAVTLAGLGPQPAPLELQIDPSPAPSPEARRVTRWLTGGARRPSRPQHQAFTAVVRGGALDPATRAIAALALYRRARDPDSAADLWRHATAAGAPAAVRHRAVVLEAMRRRAADGLSRAMIDDLIDAHLDPNLDIAVAHQLQELAG